MKIRSYVALTTLTTFLAASGWAIAADKKSEHEKMDGDCQPKMSEGRDREMHRGWNRDGGERGGEDRMQHMEKTLGLTDAQKKSMEEQKVKQKATMEPLIEKHKAAQEALRKAAESNADDATLTKLANEVGVVTAQTEVARIKARRQMASILTPEQKQKMVEMEMDQRPSRP